MSFVERRKNDSKYFRTWSKSKHKKDCPFEVTYDEERNGKFKVGEGQKVHLTDSHIAEKLKRAFEAIIKNISHVVNKSKNRSGRQEIKSRENIVYPALFNEGEEQSSGRRPYILTRKFDKLDQADWGEIRCVAGTVTSIQIQINHAYINFTSKGPNSVKVCFRESFAQEERNATQFKNFDVLRAFFNERKKQGQSVICCCIGEVKKVDSGINIYPDRYNAFTLNGLGYYDILTEMHHLR